eukprot:1635123-Pyramimonas_sp.AAC.1
MEGGSFSKCGSRFSAAHIRFQNSQEFHWLRASPFQTVALALAQRIFVLKICSHGLQAGRFQKVALALAPRTFGLNMCKSFTD